MKARKLDALLATLDRIGPDPTTAEALAELRRILNSHYGVAAARVARMVERFQIHSLLPDLAMAFDSFLVDPIKTDPSCLAKSAIAETLYRMEFDRAEPFLKGVHHVQMEPVYGGREDTAPRLRVTCALGLVRMHYPDVFVELADLLADPEAPVRMGAAQAVAYTGDRDRGVPLLRLRARCGNEPEVVAECLRGLIQLDAQNSLDFVASFLNCESPATQEYVALILAESHHPAALELLNAWWRRAQDRHLRQMGLFAIAMLRTDPAVHVLLTVISDESEADARDALAALESYRQDPHLWGQVIDRVKTRRLEHLVPGDNRI